MSSRIRIAGAFLLGTGIIVGVIFVRPEPSENAAGAILATENQGVKRTYIPAVDTDGNGATDWKEELGSMVDEMAADMPGLTLDADEDGELDDTLTGSFARSFFEDYLVGSASGELTTENQGAFLDQYIAKAERDAGDTLYTKADITTEERSSAAEREYGNAVGAAFSRYVDPEAEHELALLERALLEDDPAVLEKLAAAAGAYEHLLDDLLATPTPEGFVGTHLTLINALSAVTTNVVAMADAKNDALYALLRIGRHEDDRTELRDALVRVYERLYERGVRYTNDEPASVLGALRFEE